MPLKGPWFLQLPWRSRACIARDIDIELAFHLEMRVAELIAQGMSAADAARRAREEFGDLEVTRAYCRTMDESTDRTARLADQVADWRQDLRYAIRTLRRSAGFAAASLLTLGLALGANTAIFSVAHSVLLEPLPYGRPESLVALYEARVTSPSERYELSPANFFDGWRGPCSGSSWASAGRSPAADCWPHAVRGPTARLHDVPGGGWRPGGGRGGGVPGPVAARNASGPDPEHTRLIGMGVRTAASW